MLVFTKDCILMFLVTCARVYVCVSCTSLIVCVCVCVCCCSCNVARVNLLLFLLVVDNHHDASSPSTTRRRCKGSTHLGIDLRCNRINTTVQERVVEWRKHRAGNNLDDLLCKDPTNQRIDGVDFTSTKATTVR
jgi:hypothetical protein